MPCLAIRSRPRIGYGGRSPDRPGDFAELAGEGREAFRMAINSGTGVEKHGNKAIAILFRSF